MVEFGLAFQRSRRPEWVSFYIDYDALKRLLATAPWEFLAKLVQDIETCALHSLEEAGRIAALLRASRAEAGLEALLRLVAFVELNLVAVRKILKKHDKTFEPCTRRAVAAPGARGCSSCGCVGRRFGFRAPLVAGALWAARASSSHALAPAPRSSGSARAAQGCALLGRLLLGLGSTEPVNRRYIGEAVPPSKRARGGGQVRRAAGAAGMGCGPLLSGLLSFLLSRDDGARPRDHVFELKVDSTVAPRSCSPSPGASSPSRRLGVPRAARARARRAYGAVGASARARARSPSELLTEGAEAAPLAALAGVVAFRRPARSF
ncbi:major facilitator protein [Aureococcus anophagefferens]|uniref:Major facilitator protein n=1 Tax=Aureococcus anophagefferens TaxID=44056 RepID=A0ABR1GCV6_AURAN